VNKYTFSGGLLFVLLVFVGTGLFMRKEIQAGECVIQGIDDIERLFSYDPQEIKKRFAMVEEYITEQVDDILVIPAGDRSFDNTMRPLDSIVRFVTANIVPLFDQSYVNPSSEIRNLVQQEWVALEKFIQDKVEKNVDLFKACQAYVAQNYKKQQKDLSPESQRFVDEIMLKFKRSGLDLPADKLNELKDVTNKISALTIEFDKNIAESNKKIHVDRAGLDGLSNDFIEGLEKDADGKYILGTDYPTYHAIMKQCIVEDTRKRMYQLYNTRAYPVNIEVLNKIIALRDELAKILGYKSFAEYELEDQMIKTPKRAYDFIEALMKRAKGKQLEEFEILTKELPQSVSLSADGKMKPWDVAYLKEEYKKKHFSIDDEKVAEYFPVDHTLQEIFTVYQTLLGLKFEPVTIKGLWDPEVKSIKVVNKEDDRVLGYLLLDLYPRPGKYTHACQDTLVFAEKLSDGSYCPALSIVIANFPKPQNGRPGLLKFDDVKTFFHEFGHAMHALLGRTELATFSGTSVKRDFVETPSQMFEQWLDDKEVLQTIGRHYITGEALPENIIKKLSELLKFDSGSFVEGQGVYSLLALDVFGPGAHKDTHAIAEKLYKNALPNTQWDPDNHFEAAFGHLTGYGAQYYGYLWSRVFALDLFEQIEKEGLLSPKAGQRFIKEVLGRGGSADPDVLLKNYLGREPNQEAFFKAYGIK
jgi:thimet oligopeptidase